MERVTHHTTHTLMLLRGSFSRFLQGRGIVIQSCYVASATLMISKYVEEFNLIKILEHYNQSCFN